MGMRLQNPRWFLDPEEPALERGIQRQNQASERYPWPVPWMLDLMPEAFPQALGFTFPYPGIVHVREPRISFPVHGWGAFWDDLTKR